MERHFGFAEAAFFRVVLPVAAEVWLHPFFATLHWADQAAKVRPRLVTCADKRFTFE